MAGLLVVVMPAVRKCGVIVPPPTVRVADERAWSAAADVPEPGPASGREEAARSGPGFQITQLAYGTASDESLGLPADLSARPGGRPLPPEIAGRRVPALTLLAELMSPALTNRLVSLPQANTLAHVNYQARRFGRLQTGPNEIQLFNPEMILVKLRDSSQVGALRVEPMHEWMAVQAVKQRRDVQFAELDTFQRRQFSPNDPQIGAQWHHGVIGSQQAWNYGLGLASVQIAIVDTPFQMDHPDLACNTVNGWDVVANAPVTAGGGIVHSTMCAGMAAAVINNGVGVAGAGNCEILPININGAISEMYNATLWAANHGVRVVNISWSGANSDTLESAGYYLKTNTCGILVMSALDGSGYLNWTNQPDIYCISMTDAADNFQQTMYGPYIDFAAPGYQIYSTTTRGGYGYGSGTSYAAPLFAGVAAVLCSLNPALGPDDVIAILKSTATQLGPAQYYGSGRINFAAAAAEAAATVPVLTAGLATNGSPVIAANFYSGLGYTLWRTTQLVPTAWAAVTNAVILTNLNRIIFTDPTPVRPTAYYRVQVLLPH